MSNPLVGMTGATTFAVPQVDSVPGTRSGVTGSYVIDGTPVRVAALGLAAGLVIAVMRKAGIKFNVGVST